MDTPKKSLMRAAIAAARQGTRAVRPNPRVGAALQSQDGRILADFHKKAGQEHAERELLALCAREGVNPRGATVAVTLEPCCHHGKTPPCTEALIAAGVARVLVGVRDPFAQVNGGGIAALRAAGIEVLEDVLAAECESVDPTWLRAQRQGFSYVHVKMATSADGLWTPPPGGSLWITSEVARARGRELRTQVDALLTGRGTWEYDNPQMTSRDLSGNLLAEQPRVYVLSRKAAPDLRGTKLAEHPMGAVGVHVTDLRKFLKDLLARGVIEVLVEAGPQLTAAFLEGGLANELHHFRSPQSQGRGLPGPTPAQYPQWQLRCEETVLGGDVYSSYVL